VIVIVLIIFSVISVYEIIKYILSLNELLKTTTASEIRIEYFAYPLTSGEMKMFIVLSIFPVLIASKKLIIGRVYLILALLPIIISMLLTQSRNVFLALFICLLIYGFFNRKFLIAYIIILVAGAIFLPQSYKERVTSIFDSNHPSNESRIIMWETGIKMFKDHPLTGVGDNEITQVYKMYKTIDRHGEGAHLHSNYMMILVTTGIFGFIAYIGYFVSIFLAQLKIYKIPGDNVDRAFILGSILTNIAFHIAGIFEWIFGDHEVMTIFFFLIAVPFVILKLNQKNFPSPENSTDRLINVNNISK
jgi:O-antigen ligase